MRRALVIVALAFSIAVHAQDPNLQRGFAAGKVYDFLGLDTVSMMNGNLNVRIPIGQKYSLGPVLEYQFMLAYNSKVWEIEYAGPGGSPGIPPSWAVPETRSNAGFGWQLSLGTLLKPKVHSTMGPQQGWTYLAPDGSEHEFPTASSNPSVSYTEDGSYLRLRPVSVNSVPHLEIDFPDGHIRQFDLDGNLTEIRDRFGYRVEITRTTTQWTISETGPGNTTGRTHTVLLEDEPLTLDEEPYVQNNFKTRPIELQLTAFDDPGIANDGVAIYAFTYEDKKLQGGPCTDAPNTTEHYVPWLKTITLPDSSVFSMDYLQSSVGPCTTGILNVLTLPTQGKIRWTHGSYELTNQACVEPGAGMIYDGWRRSHAGVRVRTLEKADGTVVEKRTYTPDLPVRSGGLIWQRCTNTAEDKDQDLLERPPDVFKNTVTISEPTGPSTERVVEKTTHYFSAYPAVVDGTGTNGALSSPARGVEYGLPLVRGTPAGPGIERFLSSQVYSCNGTTCSNTVVRESYVKYALEEGLSITGDAKAINPRVEAQRTVFNDDPSCGGNCYTDSANAGFDNFGHYETTTTTSNIPGTLERTTYTDYTPDSTNWLLNKYTTSWVKQGTGDTASGARSESTFDSTTGVLKSVRTLKATGPDPASFTTHDNDLLSATCRNSNGFVTSERFFGGDTGIAPTTDPCALSHGNGHYYINHEYTFSGTAVTAHKTQYAGTTHYISNQEFDANTGLPKLSKDTSDVETKFSFDSSSRLASVKPHDRVATLYDYATTATPPKVTMQQTCPSGVTATLCATDSLTKSVYYYDDLGRLAQERRQFNSSEWATTWTTYGPLGRTKTVTVPVSELSETASNPPVGVPVTSWDYDHLGRVTLETRPDASTTSFTYLGSRQNKKFVGGEERSTEIYDGHGQLKEVRQRAAPTEGEIVTSYGYDVGGRLTSVRMVAPDGAQERTFDYDGRGFLRWESQPESGMSSYTYDARGHIKSKDQSAAATQFDLHYTYDSAERLTHIHARNPFASGFRLMKEFEFGDANITGDLRNGKLVRAARYNYGSGEGDDIYKVEELYKYGDTSGRKTDRTTRIVRVFDDLQETNEIKSIDMGVTYNALDLPHNITYPHCLDCGLPYAGPNRSNMTYAYRRGRLQGIIDFVNSANYAADGTRYSLVHSNLRTDNLISDGMGRPNTISFTPTSTTRCVRPTITTQPVSKTVPTGGGSVTLSVVASGTAPFEYLWIREDGQEIDDTQSITVTVTADTSYSVIVKNACGYEQSQTARVTVGSTCPAPATGMIAKERQVNGSWLLKPNPTAQEQRTYLWTQLSDMQQIGTTETIIVPNPESSISYRFTVTDCGGSTSTDVTLTQAPFMPQTGLVATANTTSQITVTWPTVLEVTSYVVERRSGGEWQQIGTTSTGTTTYVDTAQILAGKTYAYRVYALRSGLKSDYSNSDVATTSTFVPAVQNEPVTDAPIDSALVAINSVRAALGWGPVSWQTILTATDPVPDPGNGVMARHITSARVRMNEALQALGVPVAGYTDPVLDGVGVKALHINEVQDRAK